MKLSRLILLGCLALALAATTASAGRLFALPLDIIDPGGEALSGGDSIVELDPLTGAELNRFPAPAPFGEASGLAFDGTSLFFTYEGSGPVGAAPIITLYELDPDTGAIIDQDDILGTSGMVDGVGAAPGAVVIQDYGNSQTVVPPPYIGPDLFVFDPVTDTVDDTVDLETLNPGFVSIGGIGVTSTADGGFLMEDFDDLYFVDQTGLATYVLSMLDYSIYGVAVAGDEVFLGVGSEGANGDPNGVDALLPGQIFVFDHAGAPLRILDLPYYVAGLGGWEGTVPEVIPEPTTMALLGLGLAGIARRRRRK